MRIESYSVLVATLIPLLFSGCVNLGPNQALDTINRELSGRMVQAGNVEQPIRPARDLPVISGKLSLLDAVNMALTNNLELKAAFYDRRDVRGSIIQAYSGALPQMNVDARADTVFNETDSESKLVSLGLTQALWRSGSVSAAVRMAQWYAASTEEAIRLKAQSVIYEAASRYDDVLLSGHLVTVYKESAGVSERMLATSKSKRALGAAADHEVLRAEVEVANTKAALLNQENELRTSKIKLLQALGVSQNSDIEISGVLEYSEAFFDPDEAVRTALINRPDIVMAEANIRAMEENVNIVRSEYGVNADVFLNGAYSDSESGDDNSSGWNDEWTAGVKLSYKLFDGFGRRGKMMSAIALKDKAEVTLRCSEENAKTAVVTALMQLRYADELYLSQKKNTELASEALRIIEAGARRGKNTQVELLDSRAALTEAMGTYYRSIHAHAQARLQVRLAMGVLGPDAMTRVDENYSIINGEF